MVGNPGSHGLTANLNPVWWIIPRIVPCKDHGLTADLHPVWWIIPIAYQESHVKIIEEGRVDTIRGVAFRIHVVVPQTAEVVSLAVNTIPLLTVELSVDGMCSVFYHSLARWDTCRRPILVQTRV